MSTENYYNKTWNEPDNHGTKFFNNVNFSAPQYKYQEKVFREYLRTLDKSKIRSVLELGIGTGRMAKIMLEELPDIQVYNAIDINFFPIKINNIGVYNADVTDEIFFDNINSYYNGRRWDLILASEVFMHIKPEHIDRVIQSVTRLLAPSNGSIINIDWYFKTYESEWCFIHPYDYLYKKYGGKLVGARTLKSIDQVLLHYQF